MNTAEAANLCEMHEGTTPRTRPLQLFTPRADPQLTFPVEHGRLHERA